MQKNKDISFFKEIFKGSLINCLVFVILSFVFALLILKINIDKSNYFILLLLSAAISGSAGGFSAVRKNRENGLVYGAVSSVIPSILLIAAMSVAFSGFTGLELIPAAVSLAAGAVGGIAAVNMKKQKKIKRKPR